MTLYRCSDTRTTNGVRLYLEEFEVIRESEMYYWIDPCWDNSGESRRKIKKECRKIFACLTKEAAMKSFKARKLRQETILENQLKNCRKALELCQPNLIPPYNTSLATQPKSVDLSSRSTENNTYPFRCAL